MPKSKLGAEQRGNNGSQRCGQDLRCGPDFTLGSCNASGILAEPTLGFGRLQLRFPRITVDRDGCACDCDPERKAAQLTHKSRLDRCRPTECIFSIPSRQSILLLIFIFLLALRIHRNHIIVISIDDPPDLGTSFAASQLRPILHMRS